MLYICYARCFLYTYDKCIGHGISLVQVKENNRVCDYRCKYVVHVNTIHLVVKYGSE